MHPRPQAFLPLPLGGVHHVLLVDDQENSLAPGVKTLKALGYNVAPWGSERGLIAPAGIPPEAQQAWAASIKKALEDPQIKGNLEGQSLTIRYLGPAEWEAFWMAQEKLVREMMPKIEAAGKK